jgi:glycosyltransferase involved in cell wall biosynthesis
MKHAAISGNATPPATGLRIAMYVANDCVSDTRVLREADALAAAGHRVTIVARMPASGGPEAEEHRSSGVRLVRVPGDDGPQRWRRQLTWVRYPWRARAALRDRLGRDLRRGPVSWLELAILCALVFAAMPWIVYRFVDWRVLGDRLPAPGPGGQIDYVVAWRLAILPWAAAAAAVVPDADVHHGHDVTGLVAAVAGAADGGARIVYDSHELYVESGRHARQGRLARRWMRSQERRLADRVDVLVTVNRTLEQTLRLRLGIDRSIVVHNAPPRWTPPPERPDLLRSRLGLAAATPIVLYHGGFTAERGLLQLVDALGRPALQDAHLVLLGGGPLRDAIIARAVPIADRVHLLDAVPPDELAAWVASADVGVMPNQPVNANERLSTPNKLFESIAVGLPVVSSDFTERRRIIMDDPDGPLGAMCDPTDPASIASAIRAILALGPDASADLRRRILRAAHERWNWETEGARLVELYARLASRSDVPAPGRPEDVATANRTGSPA